MSDSICIRLPYLHDFEGCGSFGDLLHPGQTGVAEGNRWLPPDYPFSPVEADSVLRDLRGMRFSDLEAARILHNRNMVADEAAWRREMADLERLGSEAAVPDSLDRALREQAQKILLWIWAQEEAMSEISLLESSCAVAALDLRQNFLEERRETENHPARPDFSLMPPWRVCVANAALFIPPAIPVLAEGPMLEEMEEYLDFVECPSGEWSGRRTVRAPLWKVLGHSRPDSDASFYTAERIWLALENV